MYKISIVTPCYNEEDNVEELYRQVKEVFKTIDDCVYEHIFIDNDSKDRTVAILKGLAAIDQNVKIIVNSRNFGHIRSPYHALLQAQGDAVILLVADLQDPPSMIKDFIVKWKEGYKVVLGVKNQSKESPAMFAIRKMYYNFINRVSEIELTKNNTGFGLYDKKIIEILRQVDDPYPYFRGLISDIGFESYKIKYVQPVRKRGITKNNFYTLYDIAMLGITNHSKVPLRLAAMIGFLMSALSLIVALGYFIAKLIYWNSFSMGTAPLIIGLFLFSSVQLFFIGIIGEYIGSIHTQVLKRPLVVEKERINFTSCDD
ncbi:glycosyltransferase involved in cell wall biosynthesis [Fontibacillus phaseoli]|uniref:Glycosyltransferase involved in cell wall biosynthesis n=1 Tax=Fontibacillus phaseoli TaxID=1416533 RepID=A0A369BEG9_9BACL|nr:glycosyltransferase family 2 protein [Fontibacillus phaseoli]RCX19008.1 glycosyltransferase involved in cell wall biosynthesis [Fontibacillus phaseoli]